METVDEVQAILDMQEQGMDRNAIAKELGYVKTNKMTSMMKVHGYIYDSKSKKYICATDVGQVSHIENKETTVGQVCDTTSEEATGNEGTDVGQMSHTENEEVPNEQETSVGQVSDTTLDLKNDLLKKNIIGLSNNFEDLMQMLSWYRTNVGQVSDNTSQVIEVVNPGIQIDLPESENVKTSIRINKSVWDSFGEFAEQHKEFNKSDLISQALKEFIKKHQGVI